MTQTGTCVDEDEVDTEPTSEMRPEIGWEGRKEVVSWFYRGLKNGFDVLDLN